jgi:hypothetical protein
VFMPEIGWTKGRGVLLTRVDAAVDRRSMAARLGNILYWTACAAAVLWALFIFAATATLERPDWTIGTPVAIAGSFVIWGIGRVVRRFLSQQ